MSLREWATLYANMGWPVFPLVVGGKTPATAHGFKDATTSHKQIASWWSERDYNIGLATGHVFDALDVDNPGTTEMGAELYGLYGYGPTVRTPSGGFHVYVVPTGGGNRAGFIKGVDWRGIGGYVVAPPSWSTERDRGWVWHDRDLCLPRLPGWAGELLEKRPRTMGPSAPVVHTDKYTAAVVRYVTQEMRDAPEGTRNHTLNRLTFKMTKLVAEGRISLDDVMDCLGNAALEAGLGYSEIEKTMRSAINASPWL